MMVLIQILARWRICSRGCDGLVSVTSLMHVADVVEALERWGLGFVRVWSTNSCYFKHI